MTDSNADVMGGETVVVNEVNNTTESTQTEAQPSEQINKVPDSIPYDRFSNVNNEKNQYKRLYEEQLTRNNGMSENINSYLETANTQNVKQPQLETVEDVMSFINKEIDNRVKPIEQQRLQENYVANVNNYFTKDTEASGMRDQIDQYFNQLPSYRKEAAISAIAKGDLSVIDEMKNTVAVTHNKNLKTMANEAAGLDINRTITPGATKIVRETAPGVSDLIAKGKKEGNFNAFFGDLVSRSGLS